MIFMVMALSAMTADRRQRRARRTVVLSIPLVWFYCKLIVHRLHDLGWSGWWFLLLGPC